MALSGSLHRVAFAQRLFQRVALLEAGWSRDRVVSAAMESASTPEWVARDDMATAVSDFAEVYCPDLAGQ